MKITFEPLLVMIDGGPSEGRLALVEGAAVAVLSRVAPDEAEGRDGWFLEAGLGPCSTLFSQSPNVFSTLEEAENWVREQLRRALRAHEQ